MKMIKLGKLCIFCNNQLGLDTRAEHILLNCLGGRKTTTDLVCSPCNEKFGSTIDRGVSDQVALLRNMLYLKSGNGKAPPSTPAFDSDVGKIKLNNQSEPELAEKPFTITKEGEKVKISIKTNSRENLAKIIPHVAAAAKVSEDSIWNQIHQLGIISTEGPAGFINSSQSFGGGDVLRSITKSALVFLGAKLGSNFLDNANFSDAIRFVRFDDEEFNRERCDFKVGVLPNADEWKERFGPIFNILAIEGKADGFINAHFTLYNAIGWNIMLATDSKMSDFRIVLASNPLNVGQWSDDISQLPTLPYDWFALQAYDDDVFYEDGRTRFAAILEYYTKSGRERAIGIICDRVAKELCLDQDEPFPTLYVFDEYVAKVADRVAHLLTNTTHKTTLSKEKIEEIERWSRQQKD